MKYSLKIDSEICKGCRLCIRECPKDLLQLTENFNAKGWQYIEFNFKDPCIGCKKCAIVCPDAAIRIIQED